MTLGFRFLRERGSSVRTSAAMMIRSPNESPAIAAFHESGQRALGKSSIARSSPLDGVKADKPSKTVGGEAAGRPSLNRTIVDSSTTVRPTQMAVPNKDLQ